MTIHMEIIGIRIPIVLYFGGLYHISLCYPFSTSRLMTTRAMAMLTLIERVAKVANITDTLTAKVNEISFTKPYSR
jgi:hypothetical protein